VPTRAGRRELMGHGFDAVDVVARGVDPHHFSPVWRDDALRREWGAGEHDPVLIHVGRLAAEKNVGLALRSFEHLRAQHPNARMVVVGDGPQRARLQAAHPGVRFAGTLRGDELARHYASADLFLFPSQTETFGNVTLEALASGLAVVAFPLAAAQDHLRDGHNGLLARDLSAPAFTVAALRALAHGSPDSALRQQARTTALALDWTSVLGRFERRLCDVATTRLLSSHAALA
jgi:glycosyltransferase involved in cell wall biosynthesis